MELNNSTSFVQEQQVTLALQKYMTRVYTYMGLGVGLTAIISYMIFFSGLINIIFENMAIFYVSIFAELGLVWYLSSRAYELSKGTAGALFFLYAALNGITLSFVFMIYTMSSIGDVFVISTVMFGALALYGYSTKRALSGMGTFMFMGLIGLIVATVINIFLQSSAFHFAISVIGVIVFAGLTVWDTKRIKENYLELYSNGTEVQGLAINSALSLYLDFINLFLYLLRLFGSRK
jgi:FtsH-binding integral membrane protein